MFKNRQFGRRRRLLGEPSKKINKAWGPSARKVVGIYRLLIEAFAEKLHICDKLSDQRYTSLPKSDKSESGKMVSELCRQRTTVRNSGFKLYYLKGIKI